MPLFFNGCITIERTFNFIVPTLIRTRTATYIVRNHISLVKNDKFRIENHPSINPIMGQKAQWGFMDG